MSRDLVIFGCGGFAREVLQVVRDLVSEGHDWNFCGFLDGNPEKHGTEVQGFPVLGDHSWLANRSSMSSVIAIGSTAAKRKVALQMEAAGLRNFAVLIHPEARVGHAVSTGPGTIICAGNILTTDIAVGDHVILNLDCTVGHDARISSYATIAPSVNISGNVEICEGVDLGTGATIIQGIRVGEWSIVGAGSVVVRDLLANVTAVGTPAKPIKERPPGWHLEHP